MRLNSIYNAFQNIFEEKSVNWFILAFSIVSKIIEKKNKANFNPGLVACYKQTRVTRLQII